jgi:hypothetical protein
MTYYDKVDFICNYMKAIRKHLCTKVVKKKIRVMKNFIGLNCSRECTIGILKNSSGTFKILPCCGESNKMWKKTKGLFTPYHFYYRLEPP